MIGFGIVIPVVPKLIVELTGVGLGRAAQIGGWLAFAYALMQFFFGPIMGGLSDRYGRRPILLISLAVFGIDYLIMGWAPTLIWLFVGRTMAGIAGASFGPAMAYVADISPAETRAKSFGMLGAAFGIGFILGPAIGGLLGMIGPRAPFLAAAFLAFANLFYGYFFLPESLAPENRRPFDWHRAHTFGAIRKLMSYSSILGLVVTLFFWQLAHHSLTSTWSFYTMLKFHWTERDVGLSLAFVGLLAAIVQGGLTGKIIPRLGERRAVILGFSSAIIGYIGYGSATAGWMLFFWMAIASLSGLSFPSINAMMSRRIPPDAQGELQGTISSMHSVTSIIGPVMMTQVFGYFTSESSVIYLPGAAFFFAALLTIVGLVAFIGSTPAA
ncbi:TCR/Tet family MFS transporter [bacterium]|nr:TCR/Tet family MFS transporter [bacterium]